MDVVPIVSKDCRCECFDLPAIERKATVLAAGSCEGIVRNICRRGAGRPLVPSEAIRVAGRTVRAHRDWLELIPAM